MEASSRAASDSRLHLFLDANVLIKGTVAGWGASKAVLIFGAQGLVQLLTSETVQRDVERVLDRRGLLGDRHSGYRRFLRLTRLVVLPDPSDEAVETAIPELLPAVRHRADVAVIVAARDARPDWVLSENQRHFNPAVAQATGLRIVTPQAFLAELVRSAFRQSSSVPDPGSEPTAG